MCSYLGFSRLGVALVGAIASLQQAAALPQLPKEAAVADTPYLEVCQTATTTSLVRRILDTQYPHHGMTLLRADADVECFVSHGGLVDQPWASHPACASALHVGRGQDRVQCPSPFGLHARASFRW